MQHWLIQWALLQLNQSRKYITGSCFPSRIWEYFNLVRECWSENYSRGKRLRFLHQLCSGAWKTWCWAAESTWRPQWKQPVKAVHPRRAGNVGHMVSFRLWNHIYTQIWWYWDHIAHVQWEYKNVEYVSSNSWTQIIIHCHSRKHQVAHRAIFFP